MATVLGNVEQTNNNITINIPIGSIIRSISSEPALSFNGGTLLLCDGRGVSSAEFEELGQALNVSGETFALPNIPQYEI